MDFSFEVANAFEQTSHSLMINLIEFRLTQVLLSSPGHTLLNINNAAVSNRKSKGKAEFGLSYCATQYASQIP